MGVGLVVMLLASLLVSAIPVSAAAPVINEWEQFSYPAEGADGNWFRDPDISRVGPIAESTDGTLYTAVDFWCDDDAWGVDTGTLTLDEIDDTNEGRISADIDGDWGNGGFEGSFVAYLETADCEGIDFDTYMCITGTITADNLTFGGYVWAEPGDWLPEISGTWDVTEGGFTIGCCGECAPSDWGIHRIGYGCCVMGEFLLPAGGTMCFTGCIYPGSTLMKSADGGHSWAATNYAGGPIVDMVTSSVFADTIYVTDGNYVYKSVDGGTIWSTIGKDYLEGLLEGECGLAISCQPITCIDVCYDADDNPFVFIGTEGGWHLYPNGHALEGQPILGSIYYIPEGAFPAAWTDLILSCYSTGDYNVYSIG